MDRVECGRRLEDIAERYLTGEQPRRLNDERERVDRLTHRQVPAGEQHHAVAPIAVVLHDCRQAAVEHPAFGVLTPVQANGGTRVSQPDECVPEAGVEKFVHVAQPDQGPTDHERDDGRREHVDDDDPEQGSWDGERTQRQGPRKPPEDRAEREHRHHRLDGAEQQQVIRSACRIVCLATDARGEDVDVLLDALVGVVDGLTRELAAEVGIFAEPVVNEATGKPDPPAHDEPLRQIQVRQRPAHITHGQNGEHEHRRPEPVYASRSRRIRPEGDLKRRKQIVGVVAQEHVDANNEDRRQQQQPGHGPHRHAAPALEVVAGDAPVLAPPLGRAPDQNENNEQTRCGDHPHLQHPQGRVEQFVAPVNRRPEPVHPATPPGSRANVAPR